MLPDGSLFNNLEARLDVLTNKYVSEQIPFEIEPGFKPDTDHLAAYRLLVHAEIEDYLERKARTELDSISRVLNAGVFNLEDMKVIFDLAFHFNSKLTLQLPFDIQTFCEEAKIVEKAARKFIDENNGIKGASLLVCCLILNKSIDKIDPSLVYSLNAFGKARGDVAHKSVSRITTIQAPSAERQSAHNVIAELKRLFEDDSLTVELILKDEVIEKFETSGEEYSFWLKDIDVPIKVMLTVNPASGGYNFHLSHYIHTPNQIGPYRPSRPWGDDKAYALRLAVTAITQYYKEAVKAGHQPSAGWLIPNK